MTTPAPSFKDRAAAARMLAQALGPYRAHRPLILGIPAGGAMMAEVLTRELGGDLDVALAGMLPALGEGGESLGAVAENGIAFLQEGQENAATPAQVKSAGDQALQVLRRLRQRYTPQAVPISASGRLTILVDDGESPGPVLACLLLSLRESGAREVIAVSAVASVETAELLRREADVFLCLRSLGPFESAASHFEEFGAAPDREIRDFLRKASRSPLRRGAG